MTLTFKAKEANGEIINSALHLFTFPAGEKHIKQTEGREIQPVEIAIFQPTPESLHDDLFALAFWNNFLMPRDVRRVLIMPYAPGARADRGLPFGAQIYAEFIGGLLLDQTIIFDPHSAVVVDELRYFDGNRVTVAYSNELFAQPHMEAVLHGYTGIIAPDKGAVDRATAMADLANLPVYTATKHRDEATGKLSGFALDGLPGDGNYLIVDDICDGGGTFLGLAEASGLTREQVDLYVSHGVFSKSALEILPRSFGYIFTTNSYAPTRDLNVSGLDNYPVFRKFDVIRFLESKIKF